MYITRWTNCSWLLQSKDRWTNFDFVFFVFPEVTVMFCFLFTTEEIIYHQDCNIGVSNIDMMPVGSYPIAMPIITLGICMIKVWFRDRERRQQCKIGASAVASRNVACGCNLKPTSELYPIYLFLAHWYSPIVIVRSGSDDGKWKINCLSRHACL